MKYGILFFLTIALSVQICTGFEAVVFPPDPKGGEGIFLTISGEPSTAYDVKYNGITYTPFRSRKQFELFLPLRIEDSGKKRIKIARINPDNTAEEKYVEFHVRKRMNKSVVLRASDEKMRDGESMVAEQNNELLSRLRHRSGERMWDKAFRMPLRHSVSTPFALHRKGKKYSYYHKGLDISAPEGTPVKAAGSGKVIYSRRKLNVYGNTLVVDHGHGVVSCYFHLHELFKNEGDTVTKDETIATVGSSGWATGPHLHFGVYLQGVAVDPAWWIGFTQLMAETGEGANTPGVP